MKFPNFQFNGSLRWQLQLWQGVLLVVLLSGFGWTAWSLQRASIFTRVDQELEQRSQVIMRSLHPRMPRPPAPPDRPPDILSPEDMPEMGEPPPPPQGEAGLGQRDPFLDEEDKNNEVDSHSIYGVVWGMDGRVAFHSASAPPDIPYPSMQSSERIGRMRGDLREMISFLPSGECILVGKNVDAELVSLQHTAWALTGIGAVVLLASLGIGWIIIASALRPLVSINATALKIAEGDLTQRIPMPREKSEIAELVRVLNQTFIRLEASFVRQVQFTADASHELRTPISIVLTHAQNALARERSSEEYRESLAACQRSAKRMKELTESLLALVRLDHGERGSERMLCPLNQIAADAVDSLSPFASEQHIALHCDLEPVFCMGSPEQLFQVVVNLVTNAVRYNSPGGSVFIKTASQRDHLLLSIRDTGQGIAPEDIPHIFERFYRADKSRSGKFIGAGLGLAITEAIIKAHGGTIDVSSELGVGSHFIVHLPTH